jgi:hypothetical protein
MCLVIQSILHSNHFISNSNNEAEQTCLHHFSSGNDGVHSFHVQNNSQTINDVISKLLIMWLKLNTLRRIDTISTTLAGIDLEKKRDTQNMFVSLFLTISNWNMFNTKSHLCLFSIFTRIRCMHVAYAMDCREEQRTRVKK